MEEQQKPENRYQTYLHKQVSSINKWHGGSSSFKGLIGAIWNRQYEQRMIIAGKLALRYEHLQRMSDKKIKEQNANDDEERTGRWRLLDTDPVRNKLNTMAYVGISSTQNPLLEGKSPETVKDLSWKLRDFSFKIYKRTMTEKEYNYFLNTPPEQILLRLELEHSELYETRKEDLPKPEEPKASKPIVLKLPRFNPGEANKKHETSKISLEDIGQ